MNLEARTVSAALPFDTQAEPVAAAAGCDASVRAQAAGPPALDPKRIVTYEAFYLVPRQATVKVGQTQRFTMRVRVKLTPSKRCTLGDPPLLPPCWNTVVEDWQLRNEMQDYSRGWEVDGIRGGNATKGTIAADGTFGAAFKAPDRKPEPDTVRVSFVSAYEPCIKHPGSFGTQCLASLTSLRRGADVKIIDEVVQAYDGTVGFDSTWPGIKASGQMNVNWKLVEHLPGDLAKYEHTGTAQITLTHDGCRPRSVRCVCRLRHACPQPEVLGHRQLVGNRHMGVLERTGEHHDLRLHRAVAPHSRRRLGVA